MAGLKVWPKSGRRRRPASKRLGCSSAIIRYSARRAIRRAHSTGSWKALCTSGEAWALYPLEEDAVADEAQLDDFGEAVGELGARQRSQQAEIVHRSSSGINGAEEALTAAEIDGLLDAHGDVDHGKKGGRERR